MTSARQELPLPTRLLFVRHGQTESNVARRYMGQTDSPLTDLGRRQASAVARRLSRRPIAALYSSDLGRTMDTAKIIASACGHRVTSDSRLREQDFGRFEGMTVDEISQAFPEEYAQHKQRTAATVAHGGESIVQMRERVASFIDEIVERHPGETAVIVTHGGVMGAVLSLLFDTPFEAVKRTRFANTGLGAFVRERDRWILECWNDTGHLDDLGGD